MSNKVSVPSIETENYILSPLTMRYSKGMYKLWSSEEVCKYSGDADDFDGAPIPMPVTSSIESDKIIDFFLRHQNETGKGFRWAITSKDQGTFFGAIGYNSLGSCSEIAYHLHPDYWGRGIMTEAAQTAIDWVRDEWKAREVEAYIDLANTKSISLLERMLFRKTESLRDGAARFSLLL